MRMADSSTRLVSQHLLFYHILEEFYTIKRLNFEVIN